MATALEDIPDLQGWVKWQVARFCSKGQATSEEFDELSDQGVVLLYELHADWDKDRCPKFSAYAISLFQKRLISYFRKELNASGRGYAREVVNAEGSRTWQYSYHGKVPIDGENMAIAFSQESALTTWDTVE